SKAMRMIVRRALRQAGFVDHDVTEADSGAAALEVIRAAPPDVVMCDWNMPEMSGLDLLTAVTARGTSICFGFITSEISPEMRQKAEQAGAAFYIGKPFTVDRFREALEGI